MRNVFFYTYMLLYAAVAFFGIAALFIVKLFTGAAIGKPFLILLLADIPVAFVLLKALLGREKNKPEARLHDEMMREIRTNGVSEKSNEIADRAIREYKAGGKCDVVYLKDFALMPADYYNLHEDYAKAESYVKLLDGEEIKSGSLKFIDGGISLLSYYEVKTETLRGLGRREDAAEVLREAEAEFSKKNDTVTSMILDVIRYHCRMLFGEYDEASELAGRMLSYTGAFADLYVGKYYCNAELAAVTGDRDKAVSFMNTAFEKIVSKAPALREYHEAMRIKLGLSDSSKN